VNQSPVPISVIETARLRLRGPVAEDLDNCETCYANPAVVRYLPKRSITPRERAASALSFLEGLWLQPDAGFSWVIARKAIEDDGKAAGSAKDSASADGRFVGWCAVERSAHTGEPELRYTLDEPYWGQGYATEAARAAVRYGFERAGWERITAAIIPGNEASRRVLEHIGFEYEKDIDYYAKTGDTTIVMDSPMIPAFALRREQFAPGDAPYHVIEFDGDQQ
jgi:ribosomal-protein-alanine N-acetyltransferase